ncbi:MAG: nucleotidyltransferase domain-containing protein [Patescibacteria group bacterium]
MSKIEVEKIIKKYAKKLKEKKYSFSAIYLFGSFAKGNAREYSDIDIAVISEELNKERNKAKFKLWKLTEGIDSRIEPHGFSPEDFKEDWIPIVHEIKKTGIRVV